MKYLQKLDVVSVLLHVCAALVAIPLVFMAIVLALGAF